MKEFVILSKYNNKDIYYVIKKEYPNLSNASLNKAFRIKDIRINDKRVSKDYIVKTKDICKIYIKDTLLYGYLDAINYVYEDDNILVAYKPKGVVSNHEKGPKNLNNIYFDEQVKKEKGEEIKILNRLDTNTEGLVIFSKNRNSYDELFNAFKEKKITKEYIAIVNGKFDKTHDVLSHYIKKDSKACSSKVYAKEINNSKTCITEYDVIKYVRKLNLSVLKLVLHTGRTHQIRAHMKYIHHELLGDSKYGINEINNKYNVHSQVLYAVKYSFNFNEDSFLSYLNEKVIDITNEVITKINNLLEKL